MLCATVYGCIKTQGWVYVGPGVSLKDAIERAGGLTELAQRQDIRVIWHNAPPESEAVRLDLDRAGATFTVLPGDSVYVRERLL